MSASSVKSSIKKGFKAPVLNVLKNEEKETHFKDNGEFKKSKKKYEESGHSAESEATPKEKKIKKAETVTKDAVKSGESLQKERKLKKAETVTKDVVKSGESLQKERKLKKPEMSLTDSQYEELFRAVLRESNSQHETSIEELIEAVASSSQKSSVKGSQLKESEGSAKTAVSLPELSPWGSRLGKQNSQASSILKELQESQVSSLLSPEPTSSSEDTEGEAEVNEVLSQQSVRQLSRRSAQPAQTETSHRRRVDKRAKLEELQALRNVGLWVFCDRMTCQKQRYLPHVTDPQELPDVWYCHMNPDPRYNSCSCEKQQPSPEEEEDMIDNRFTCGSVVWAQVVGYPWWPALVDDDPDLECYYWLDEGDMRTVTFYHVVFFDKNEITRAWIPIKKIVPFKNNRNTFKQRVVRGIDFSSRLAVAREQAEQASSLNIVQRLKKFSFIARYKGPIFDEQSQAEKTKKKYNLKCSIGTKEAAKRGRKRRANKDKETSTPFESVVKTSKAKKYQKQMKQSEKEIENKPIFENEEIGLAINIELSKLAEQVLNKPSGSGSLVIPSSEPQESYESKLCSNDEKQGKNDNPQENPDGKITVENKNSYSETPSGLCNNSKLYFVEENAHDSREKVERKPPSMNGSNKSHKSKPCSSKPASVVEHDTQDSQSTIADFLAAETDDAVVPEADFSQPSQPFEE